MTIDLSEDEAECLTYYVERGAQKIRRDLDIGRHEAGEKERIFISMADCFESVVAKIRAAKR